MTVLARVAAVALPLAALLCLPPGRWLPFQQPKSFYGGLAVEGVGDLLSSSASAASLKDVADGSSFFDSDSLHLAPPSRGDDDSGFTDSGRRPQNVVFILLESVRSRSTTPYNSTLNTTPFLDSLAGNALRVEDMTSIIPQTNKSLVPIFAGIPPRPVRRVVEGDSGGLAGHGLPALLSEHGYATAFFSSATTDFRHQEALLRNLGFEQVIDRRRFSTEGFEEISYFGYGARAMSKPSLTWLDSVRASGSSFFAAYKTLAAHHPYETPSSFKKQRLAANPRLNKYLNAVRYADDWLRELFAEYERRGLIDSTLFVIVGDHGQAFGEHGRKTHGDIIWDEALEVPALIYNPHLFPEGRTAKGARQQTDLLPTVADLLGYELRGGMVTGRSLLEESQEGRALFHFTRNPSQYIAMRRGGRKFIYGYDRSPMKVFDLRDDPMERNDIAARFSDTELQSAKRQMLRWRWQVDYTYSQHPLAP